MTLREARQEKGLSQEALAAITGLTQVTVSLIETGKVAPQAATRRRIEKALGVRVNWLQTKGLRSFRDGQMSTWEYVEQTFRKALLEVKGLSRSEQKEFLKLAKQYLKEFEGGIKATQR